MPSSTENEKLWREFLAGIISAVARVVLAFSLGVGGCLLIGKMPNVETATPRSSAPSVTCPCHFCFCWRCVGK